MGLFKTIKLAIEIVTKLIELRESPAGETVIADIHKVITEAHAKVSKHHDQILTS